MLTSRSSSDKFLYLWAASFIVDAKGVFVLPLSISVVRAAHPVVEVAAGGFKAAFRRKRIFERLALSTAAAFCSSFCGCLATRAFLGLGLVFAFAFVLVLGLDLGFLVEFAFALAVGLAFF